MKQQMNVFRFKTHLLSEYFFSLLGPKSPCQIMTCVYPQSSSPQPFLHCVQQLVPYSASNLQEYALFFLHSLDHQANRWPSKHTHAKSTRTHARTPAFALLPHQQLYIRQSQNILLAWQCYFGVFVFLLPRVGVPCWSLWKLFRVMKSL
jgi:hypothetical protein